MTLEEINSMTGGKHDQYHVLIVASRKLSTFRYMRELCAKAHGVTPESLSQEQIAKWAYIAYDVDNAIDVSRVAEALKKPKEQEAA
jgi:hypothetical protein